MAMSERERPFEAVSCGGEALTPTVGTDARQLRTRRRLVAVTMALSIEQQCMDLKVAHVAEHAHVSRSTFYAHAPTPSALLESVLHEELEALYDEYLAQSRNSRRADVGRMLAAATLQHVEAHQGLYRMMLANDACGARLRAVMHNALCKAIERTIRVGLLSIPDGLRTTPDSRGLLRAAAISGVAAAMVATTCEWLELSSTRNHSAYFEALRLVLPAWWPLNTQRA